jgi:hypothetical protein
MPSLGLRKLAEVIYRCALNLGEVGVGCHAIQAANESMFLPAFLERYSA